MADERANAPEKDMKPTLHIDSDWKAQAAAEKEKLRRKEEEKASSRERAEDLPPASFDTLVDILASQALSGLGMFADKASGGIIVDLPMSKLNIDLLAVVEEKTKDNLSADEHAHLQMVLSELRARFVQLANLVAKQGGPLSNPEKPDDARRPRLHTP